MQLEQQTPRTPAQITALLRDEGERWAMWVESQSDDFARGADSPFGVFWPSPCYRHSESIGMGRIELRNEANKYCIFNK